LASLTKTRCNGPRATACAASLKGSGSSGGGSANELPPVALADDTDGTTASASRTNCCRGDPRIDASSGHMESVRTRRLVAAKEPKTSSDSVAQAETAAAAGSAPGIG